MSRYCSSLVFSLPPPPSSPLLSFLSRVQLYLQDSLQETKELHLSEAKGTLIRHPYLLAELEEWEKSCDDHSLLTASQSSLVGRKASVYNVQGVWPRWFVGVVTTHNLQTKELTVQEDCSQNSHTVNPFTVHVVLREQVLSDTNLRRSSSHSLQVSLSLPPSLPPFLPPSLPPSLSLSPIYQLIKGITTLETSSFLYCLVPTFPPSLRCLLT